MIIRAALTGLLLWFALAAGLFFFGAEFFTPTFAPSLILFVAAPVAAAILTFLLLKLLRVAPGDEAEAACALAFPGMGLSAWVAINFEATFPEIDGLLDSVFAGLMLMSYAAMIFTGILCTRLAPQDERL
ncbi:MAG: hypothetical protein GC206_13080 [Alphaproteobacteria bacterium]|nr:hypothetical protein [Alphaproteobacteria bacterium]